MQQAPYNGASSYNHYHHQQNRHHHHRHHCHHHHQKSLLAPRGALYAVDYSGAPFTTEKTLQHVKEVKHTLQYMA